jgi:hypothetical protein
MDILALHNITLNIADQALLREQFEKRGGTVNYKEAIKSL